MEKKLLILGLLLSHGMHGYQLNDMLEKNPGTPISLKKSNAYKLLGEMEQDGWITAIQEQEGNRPLRRVYSVTEKGKAAFFQMLQENLSSYSSPEFPSLVGLDFLYFLPAEEAASLLETRVDLVKREFRKLDAISSEIRQSHFVTDYLHQYYVHQIEWLTNKVNKLRSN